MHVWLAPLVILVTQVSTSSSTPPASLPQAPDADGAIVTIDTSLGMIKIRLNREKAPVSVDNFLKYVRAGHYDGTIFHRVIPGFMIQAGGFDADMKERGTRAPIRNEAKNGVRNLRGTLAMARTNDPDSATAQFFINVKDNASLDFGIRGAGYAVFGEVLEGMDVVDKIVAVPTTTKGPHQNVPQTSVLIRSAREVKAAGKTGGAAPQTAPKAKPTPKP